jgi:hypothetical protein
LKRLHFPLDRRVAGLRRLALGPFAMAVGASMGFSVPGVFAHAQLPEYVLVEERRLGGPEGQGPSAFSSEPLVVVDRRGALFTRGQRDSEIRVFDSVGTFLRTIGRRGQGPGEFSVIPGMGSLAIRFGSRTRRTLLYPHSMRTVNT